MKVGRKEFLLGFGGVISGVPLGVVGQRRLGRAPEDTGRSSVPPALDQAKVSHSQCGEDVVAGFLFDYLKVEEITYLDIGAWDPILINNTVAARS